MKWFKHDSNAQSDAKLEKLRIRYGMEGYGLYWYCLELIVGNIEAHNITFQLEHDSEIIAKRTDLHVDHVQEMMKYMVDLGLFENRNGNITCFKIAKRLDSSMTSNHKLRDLIKRFHESSHDAVMMPSGHSHDSVMQEEKRREENRYRGTKKFKPPTLQEVTDYCSEKGIWIDPERFIDHYEANGWFRGKTKIKDWKACVRTWGKNARETQPESSYGEGGI